MYIKRQIGSSLYRKALVLSLRALSLRNFALRFSPPLTCKSTGALARLLLFEEKACLMV